MDIIQARAKRDEARTTYTAAQNALYEYRKSLLARDAEYQRLLRLTCEAEHRAGLALLEYRRYYASKPDNRAAAAKALERALTQGR